MKLLFSILTCAILPGCAGQFTGLGSSTVLWDKNGKRIFASSGEHAGLKFKQTATETSLEDLTLNHKPTTDAQWRGVNNNLKELGNVATKVGDAYSKIKTP